MIELEFDLLICDWHQKTAEKNAFLTNEASAFILGYLKRHRPSAIPELADVTLTFQEVYPNVTIVTEG